MSAVNSMIDYPVVNFENVSYQQNDQTIKARAAKMSSSFKEKARGIRRTLTQMPRAAKITAAILLFIIAAVMVLIAVIIINVPQYREMLSVRQLSLASSSAYSMFSGGLFGGLMSGMSGLYRETAAAAGMVIRIYNGIAAGCYASCVLSAGIAIYFLHLLKPAK